MDLIPVHCFLYFTLFAVIGYKGDANPCSPPIGCLNNAGMCSLYFQCNSTGGTWTQNSCPGGGGDAGLAYDFEKGQCANNGKNCHKICPDSVELNLTQELVSGSLVEGSTVKFHCSFRLLSTANVPQGPRFDWSLAGTKINSGRQITTDKDFDSSNTIISTLTFDSVSTLYSGSVICAVFYDSNIFISKEYYMQVLTRPVVEVYPLNLYVHDSEEFQLRCSTINVNPTAEANYTWFQDNRVIDQKGNPRQFKRLVNKLA